MSHEQRSHLIKPYGDTLGDGVVQLSFTLPVPFGEEAKEAAKQLARKMGLKEPQVYHAAAVGKDFTFLIVYGKCIHSVDYSQIVVPKVETKAMDFYQINERIRQEIGRKVVVVGACTGTDAHTVGIDAIMNMKGYHGDYGLERYPEMEAYNMGSQVANEDLIAKALEVNADVLLVSQVVTQKDIHVKNLTQLIELLEAEGLRDRWLVICGGPRINHEIALELGYDAGFGAGTTASVVASYIVEEMIQRKYENKNRASQ
ncbi:cobalamin-dependent protein [Microaerobacter geothermalis]|uniref:lysine 5,6-aminomutase subunit beta n=1 Tax=Microaerobacter geothermalis TaxID=674972 RepID=UPI001EEB6545|nr:OAM dimerization domain-containing protein [Microaerobacter geothermalis]MCF6094090.1 cobalamin-dependent protein [Microaerobacter geothermalis]